MRPDIELHIEELVLHGFGPADRDAIGDAVRRELSRLLAEGEVPAAWACDSQTPALDGGSFEAAPGPTPDTVGTQIAQALHGGLTR